MDYRELNENYLKLLEENRRLKAENLGFRKQLGLETEPCQSLVVEETGQDKREERFSPQEKIELFMSLFRGRDDVYAKRWVNKKGEPGYSPVCLNKWVPGVCSKPKVVKCTDCNNKNYGAMSPGVIEEHLRGEEIYGVYPLLEDETCYFLAMDFDGDHWMKEIGRAHV